METPEIMKNVTKKASLASLLLKERLILMFSMKKQIEWLMSLRLGILV